VTHGKPPIRCENYASLWAASKEVSRSIAKCFSSCALIYLHHPGAFRCISGSRPPPMSLVSPSGSVERVAAIPRAEESHGVVRFPNELCTDRGRAINQRESGWQKTLTGYPKELYDFWEKQKIADIRLDFKSSTSPEGDLAISGLR